MEIIRMPESHILEPEIIQQARRWATGATIHDVNGLIGLWYAGYSCLKVKNRDY
jgi:hypothetical protein